MAVYFFYGEEDFNIDLELDSMRSKLNPDFLSMSYQLLDAPDYQALINAIRTTPMMFGNMLIVVDAADYFFDKKKKSWFDDGELADIEEALNNVADSLDVVFTVKVPRGENKKIDTRRKLFKILNKHNSKEFAPFVTYKPELIVDWIKKRAKTKGLSIDNDAAMLMIEQIGNELRLFDEELDKLMLIAHPHKSIKKEHVEQICISTENVFNIIKSIISNDKGKALLEYKKLLDVKYPLEILSVLQTMLRQYIIVKSVSSESDVVKMAGVSPNRVFVLKRDVKNVNLRDLVRLKTNLYEAECKIKSGQSLNPEAEVEYALIR